MSKTKLEGPKGAPIVKPSTRVVGEKHVLEKLFEGDPKTLPEIKSIGFARFGAGNSWVSYIVTTKGREVVAIECDEPNLRVIAEESTKMNFMQQFGDQGV